ncbi:ABC transporter [Candidatus Heimdallarchaeota archaeon B3_Heim]|nr:MAG: ABC transporter [Candidatus Heimdallarchaeota archaeon B3_Heim]
MNTTGPFFQLLQYMRPHRTTVILATIFSILNKLFDLAPPFLISAAVDIAVRRENSIFALFGITEPSVQFIVLGLLTFIIWGFESLFEYIYKIYWRNLAQTVEHELRMDAYKHLQDLELEYFEDRQTGGLMSILNDDINQLERFLDISANDLIQVTVTAIAISFAFFLLSPRIAWMALVPMPFILTFAVLFQARLEPKYRQVREKVGILNGMLSNNLTGIATIKSYTTESFEANRISKSSNAYRMSNEDAIKFSSAFSPLIRMIIVIGFTAMLIFGGFQTIDGTLEVAAYSAMIFLTQRLLWPLTRMGETFDQYQRAMASVTRIMGLFETESKIQSGSTDLPLDSIQGKLCFENVNFSYKGREVVFSDLSVNINPGQTVAFVGSTGSGKTTIVKLLLRLYDPTNGKITLDDNDLRDLKLQDLRKGIGLVSQDTYLIDGTVRENIIYGRQDASMERIVEAAKIAEVHEFITNLPYGYDTLVGERGQKLSGGQRQRISIARAILKDPPILVLDEATSSVDNETEAAIQRSLEKIILDRTTILIAHRLSTVRNADRIYVIEHGQIIEEGTHEELVKSNKLYTTLWNVQTGKAILQR